MISTTSVILNHIPQFGQKGTPVLSHEVVPADSFKLQAELCCTSHCLCISVDCDLSCLINRYVAKRVGFGELNREISIPESLVNHCMTGCKIDHFCIINRQVSCIIESVICKSPWDHQPNGMQMQVPVSITGGFK